MSLVDRLAGALGFRRMGVDGGAPAAPDAHVDGRDRAIALPSLVITPNMLTFAAARSILEEHEQGRFRLSAALARTVMRDPDLAGAMQQRLLGLVGADHCIEAATSTGPGERYARDFAESFRTMVPRAAELDIVRDGIMLGVGCGQVVWWFDELALEAFPVLEPWPVDALEHDPIADQWCVLTRAGRTPITAGDGQWLLYTPWSTREPYFYGAIRQIAEWYLRASNAARDYGRFIELSGQGIIKAKVPSGSRGTPEYSNFLSSLRNMGRNAVVPLPQGEKEHQSYDLELEALAADLHKVFVEMLRVAGGKLRLCILGQDLTSQNNVVGTNASSDNGMKVSGAVGRSDSSTWADCLRAQFIVPWALYRGRPELAPHAYYDLDDDDATAAEATAANTAADALTKWRALLKDSGKTVDVVASAERWGVATMAEEPAPGARRLTLVAHGRGRRIAA